MSMKSTTMRRAFSQYECCSPEAISQGSQAQVMFFVRDAKHDIAALRASEAELVEALRECVAQLPVAADVVKPGVNRVDCSDAEWDEMCAITAKAKALIAKHQGA